MIEIDYQRFALADLNGFVKEMFEELKREKHRHLEDMA